MSKKQYYEEKLKKLEEGRKFDYLGIPILGVILYLTGVYIWNADLLLIGAVIGVMILWTAHDISKKDKEIDEIRLRIKTKNYS